MKFRRLYSYTNFFCWLIWVVFLYLVPPDSTLTIIAFFALFTMGVFSSTLFLIGKVKKSLLVTVFLVGLVFFQFIQQLNWPTVVIFTVLIASLSLLGAYRQ